MLPTAAKKRARVRFCIPWWKVVLLLAGFYLVVIMLFYSYLGDLDLPRTRSSNPLSNMRPNFSSSWSIQEHRDHEDQPLENAPYLSKVKEMESILSSSKHKQMRSCRYRSDLIYSQDDSCPSTPITYYNPLDRERRLCGETIPAKGSIERSEPCWEPSRLLEVVPDLTGKGVTPITLRFDDSRQSQHAKEFTDCDIPCLSAGQPSLESRRTVDGTDWTITFSMEGPEYFQNLRIQPQGYLQNKFWSTTSYRSEVPLPYFSWAEYQIQKPVLDFDQAIKGAVFLARNCNSVNHREKVIKQLQSSFRVDSLSSCLHNAQPPPGVNLRNKTDVMRHYLFYLAFENQNVDDYITEKLWGPYEAGTLPVYLGAPNINEHVPPHSIIRVDDFESTDKLAEYLNQVANDRQLYESYHAWRKQPLPAAFHAKYDFTAVHSTCRTCRWAYARMYGLGWNHANQSLQDLTLPRDAYLGERGLMKKPFREVWSAEAHVLSVEAADNSSGSCPLESTSRLMIDNGRIRRTVWQQDGVIDMLVENIGQTIDMVLRIETPLTETTTFQTVKSGYPYGRIQNGQTRLSFLTMPTCKQSSPGNGVVEVSIKHRDLPLRIRFIVEDMDTFHEGADQEETYFGKIMRRDFFNPVEAFVEAPTTR